MAFQFKSPKCFDCKVSLNPLEISPRHIKTSFQCQPSGASHLQCSPITMTSSVLEVDKKLLKDMETLGFSQARAARALHYSGNTNLEDAVRWIIDHENAADIDEMPVIAVNIEIESPQSDHITEKVEKKDEEISDLACQRKEEEKKLERDMEKEIIRAGKELFQAKQIAEENERKIYLASGKAEKEEEKRAREKIHQKIEADKDIIQAGKELFRERIHAGKELLQATQIAVENEMKRYLALRKAKKEEEKRAREEIRQKIEAEKERIRASKELFQAKQIAEENERKRYLASRKAEEEEEKRAREKIRQKIEADKVERRQLLGLPSENPASLNPSKSIVEDELTSLPVMAVTKTEQMRECLRSLRRNHKEDDARVKRAFHTLLIYVGNVIKNPNEEKYKKIRLGNPLFQERVGSLKGGIEFLELCGFEKTEGGDFLCLPSDKVEMEVLNSAGSLLRSAMTNPFFGLLSG